MTVAQLRDALEKFPPHWSLVDKAGDDLALVDSAPGERPWCITLAFEPHRCTRCQRVRVCAPRTICAACYMASTGMSCD